MTSIRVWPTWFWAGRCVAYETAYWIHAAERDRYAALLQTALDRRRAG